MLYLLDANVLITAHSQYYPIYRVPEFWEWLAHQAGLGLVKVPIETYEEVKDGSTSGEQGLLYGWVQDPHNRSVILLDEEVDQALVSQVVTQGYASDLTDDEIEQLGNDPFLIAYGLASLAEMCVVTLEKSRPSAQRQNRKVTDVCNTLGVTWCDPFMMYHTLGFSTKWRVRTVRCEKLTSGRSFATRARFKPQSSKFLRALPSSPKWANLSEVHRP